MSATIAVWHLRPWKEHWAVPEIVSALACRHESIDCRVLARALIRRLAQPAGGGGVLDELLAREDFAAAELLLGLDQAWEERDRSTPMQRLETCRSECLAQIETLANLARRRLDRLPLGFCPAARKAEIEPQILDALLQARQSGELARIALELCQEAVGPYETAWRERIESALASLESAVTAGAGPKALVRRVRELLLTGDLELAAAALESKAAGAGEAPLLNETAEPWPDSWSNPEQVLQWFAETEDAPREFLDGWALDPDDAAGAGLLAALESFGQPKAMPRAPEIARLVAALETALTGRSQAAPPSVAEDGRLFQTVLRGLDLSLMPALGPAGCIETGLPLIVYLGFDPANDVHSPLSGTRVLLEPGDRAARIPEGNLKLEWPALFRLLGHRGDRAAVFLEALGTLLPARALADALSASRGLPSRWAAGPEGDCRASAAAFCRLHGLSFVRAELFERLLFYAGGNPALIGLLLEHLLSSAASQWPSARQRFTEENLERAWSDEEFRTAAAAIVAHPLVELPCARTVLACLHYVRENSSGDSSFVRSSDLSDAIEMMDLPLQAGEIDAALNDLRRLGFVESGPEGHRPSTGGPHQILRWEMGNLDEYIPKLLPRPANGRP